MTAALPIGLLALAAGGAAAWPPAVEHPRSREARERLAAGDPEAALDRYRSLEADVGPRAEIEVGRGAALLRAGRVAEARELFGRAGVRDAPEPSGSRALVGLGDALAAQGDLDGAIAATREALRRDPGSGDARHNLEVLLRRLAEAGAPRPVPDRVPAPGSSGPPDRGAGAGMAERPEGRGREEGGGGRGEAARAGGAASGGSPEAAPGREEAERLLDALRSRERSLPAARRGSARRRDAVADW